MIPCPTDIEKNTCPNAALQMPSSVSTAKFGVKRNPAAWPHPDNVVAYTASATSSKNTVGITTFDIRSIPPRTPIETTPPVTAVAMTKYPTGRQLEVNGTNVVCEPVSQERKNPSTHPVRTR